MFLVAWWNLYLAALTAYPLPVKVRRCRLSPGYSGPQWYSGTAGPVQYRSTMGTKAELSCNPCVMHP